MAKPLVTICVPTRNRVASLKKSIQKILDQDYTPLEIIISDNASTDGTEAFCEELERSDHRVRYVRHPKNIGLHGNLNFCLGSGDGEFLCIFHDHDDHEANIVSTYVAFLCEHLDVGLVCSDWELIDEEGRSLGTRTHDVKPVTPGLEYIERATRSGRSSIGIPGAMIRREALGTVRFVDDAPWVTATSQFGSRLPSGGRWGTLTDSCGVGRKANSRRVLERSHRWHSSTTRTSCIIAKRTWNVGLNMARRWLAGNRISDGTYFGR